MPHAEENSMPNAMVNGEEPPSRFISHLKSYPVVSDSIEAYKSHPYGAKSLSLASQASDAFVAPVLPYAQRPYSYVRPYVARADQAADSGLAHLDSYLPVVKKDTRIVQAKARGLLGYPLAVAGGVRDHVVDTWFKQYQLCDEPRGLTSAAKATFSTTLVTVSDALGWLGDFVVGKKREAEQKLHEKRNQ